MPQYFFFFLFPTVLIECKNANELLGENFLWIRLDEFEDWAVGNFEICEYQTVDFDAENEIFLLIKKIEKS